MFKYTASLLILTLIAPIEAVDTLDVKVTENGPWTVYEHGELGGTLVPRLVTTRDGSVWAGGGYRFDGKGWVRYTVADGAPESLNLPVEDANGILWFSGAHRGKPVVAGYDGQAWQIVEVEGIGTNGPRLEGSLDASGNIWWQGQMTDVQSGQHSRSLGGHGILRFDPVQRTWHNYRVEDGLSHNRVYDVATGSDGSVWVATLRDVSRYDGQKWMIHTRGDNIGSSKGYRVLPARDGKVWVTHGAQAAISVYDGRVWKQINWTDGMPVNRVRSVHEASDGAIWFGTNPDDQAASGASGLLRYKDGMWLRITRADGLPGDIAQGITQSEDGDLFMVVSGAGVVRYRPDFSVLGMVSGNVIGRDGQPIVGAGIRVEDGDGEVRGGGTTDLEGQFRVQVFPGVYRVSVVLGQGAEPAQVTVLAKGDVKRIDFTPERVGIGKDAPAGQGKRVVAGEGKGLWRTYDVQDGLAAGGIWTIIQDRSGDLWFGAHGGGVSRYDGRSFTTYTTEDSLSSNSVNIIYEDRNKTLWIGTSNGVSRLRDGVFTTLIDSLPNPNVQAVYQDNEGSLWFGSISGGGGLSKYNPKARPGQAAWTTFGPEDGLVDNRVEAITQDRPGAMWFGTSNGASRYDLKTDTWTRFSTADGLVNNRIFSVYEDQSENLWFGTWGGVSRYDGRSFTNFTAEHGLRRSLAVSVIQDREQNMWFGVYAGGVSRYNGKDITTFTSADGLRGDDVIMAFQDREGTFWFGHYGGGVSRYNAQELVSFVDDEGLPSSLVYTVFRNREGNLWFGTPDGVSRYDGTTFVTFTTDDGLVEGDVFSIFQDRSGNMWFGALEGVCRYDGQTFRKITDEDGLPLAGVRAVIQDRRGDMWFSGGNSSYRYNGRTLAAFGPNDGLSSSGNAILMDRAGNLWFGGPGGVTYYDGKTFTRADEIGSLETHAIFEDREGVLWFGSEGGLHRFDGTEWLTFTHEDGLADNQVLSITQDEAGHLWIGTAGGASRYNGKTFQTLSEKDGLAGDVVNSVTLDKEGALWFATLTGVTRFRQPDPAVPSVAIDAVVADRRREGVSEVSIPSGVLTVAFEFHGKNFKTRPEAMVYRYRLKGYEADWINTRKTRVEYLALPRGDYAFEVQAVDRDLVYSDVASVALIVHLPYERVGLWSALGIAAIVLIAQGARIVRRDRRLHEANQKLETSNEALSAANHELFGANQELQRDRAVARIRAEVQSMDEAEDFDKILGLVTEHLKTVGLNFDACEIDLLNEPVEAPTMDHFEKSGFRYTTYMLNPDGEITTESYNLIAPFPTVNHQMVERFIKGEPWHGRSDDLSLVEVAAGSYGRLRLVSSTRETFTDEEVAMLQAFSNAIALGYARYLDIRTIQEQTERKSAFLASMSHEFRTPMNAIKGFTNLVLRRSSDVLPERQQENLKKVDQASDHLLAMINDLLDLSKIEAGYVDVSPTQFQVEDLIASCVSTVSPLVQEGVALKYEVNDVREAHTDEARLRQMVINLLSNAVKFTEKGEVKVTVGIQETEYRRQEGGESELRETLEISVVDTGKGISEEELPTIFDEYRQVKGAESRVQKGTGLGLSITKKFAELLGGTIRVESEEGRGSTFTVRVPVVYRKTEEG